MRTSGLKPALANDIDGFGSISLWLIFRCLPCVVLLAVIAVSGLGSVAAASEMDRENPGSGQMSLQSESGVYSPAVLQSSKAHFDISGMVATVTLQQSFTNTSNDFVEGVYTFPLPEFAAVRRLEMLIGDRRILGQIREREEARKIYEQAKSSGKKAALVEQQRTNLFTNRVANVGPGETIHVTLEYVQQVEYRAGRFSLRLPTTITPRYIPGTPLSDLAEFPEPGDAATEVSLQLSHGWAMPTDQVPDADLISALQYSQQGSDSAPLNPIEITAQLDMGMPLAAVESPNHEIAMSRRAGVYEVELAHGRSEMNRDFVLQWQPVTGSAPSAALFTEKVAGDYYGLLMLLPPGPGKVAQPMPRELIFVVDTSGSMGGVSIRQARDSLDAALRQLRPIDRFNIIEFNSNYRPLYRQAMPATPHHIQQAREFVRHLSASGGTEMLPALLAALRGQAEADQLREQPSLRQVIFITDGAVGNEAALFEQIRTHLGNNRLFTVGIGSAPNSWFMRKSAQFGRGTYTHIGALSEVAGQMSSLFGQLSQPAAIELRVDWPASVEAWPQRMPDLYLGEPLMLAVKFGEELPSGVVKVHGSLAGRDWSTALDMGASEDPEHKPEHRGVASIWANYKIESLLDEKAWGKPESEVRNAVLPVALDHQLISPYTSFVAVEERISRVSGKRQISEPVPNSRPLGQSPQPFAYPNTATTARAQIWMGAFALILALLVRATRQEEAGYES